MSRSKHTDPRSIQATRRLRAPREERGAGDLSRRRRLGHERKHAGVSDIAEAGKAPALAVAPRIGTQPSRAGWTHPVNKADVRGLLEAVGPAACYGLRAVELVRQPGRGVETVLRFGCYDAGARAVLLFEQPLAPWHLPGVLPAKSARRLRAAGARVTRQRDWGVTLVEWPEDTLRQFMLEDVLLHELGHHVLQHEKARRGRVARTQDHEAFAAQFAARQRRRLRDQRRPAR